MSRNIKLEYSKKQVRKAGKIIGDPRKFPQDKEDAWNIISQFRGSHQYPMLCVANNVRNYAKKINPEEFIIAQRIKRMPTIIDKLERYRTMNVVTMQDLGGCRAIMPNISEVLELRDALQNQKKSRNQIKRTYDYLSTDPGPKESGYRGIHLVYEYMATKKEYEGYQIELQLRTALQHAWATAVETIDLFSGNRIKYSDAKSEYKRYFVLASSLMAISEHCPVVPGVRGSRKEIVHELKQLESEIRILEMLESYKTVVNEHSRSNKNSYLTLSLDRNERKLHVEKYSNMFLAEENITKIEQTNNPDIDAVLINVGQIGRLKSAYPNYFADTEMFSSFITEEAR